MKSGFGYSVALHITILMLMLYGLPFLSFREMKTDYAIVAEVVPVSELTNVKVKASDRKDKEETQSKKAPKSQSEQAEKQEEKPKDSKKEPEKEAEKIPDKKEKIKEKEKPKEEKKKEDHKKDEKKDKKKDQTFEKNILKSLQEDSKKDDNKKVDKSFKEMADALKGDTNKPYNENLPMSISEIDAIKSQIIRNWNTSAFSGANDKGMEVSLLVELDMDANVLKVTPKRSSSSSPYYGVFVESAVRAVKKASPLTNLNKEKYHSWKEIELRFDSAGMIY